MPRTRRALRAVRDDEPRPIELPPPPQEVSLLTVRVELDEAEQPVWRQLEVRGDLTLERLHDVVQLAMGWTDSHLHHFYPAWAESAWSGPAFLTRFDLSEGEEGVTEAETRLDQTVGAVGDQLCYVYDFGDNWDHTLTVESVRPASGDSPAARCLAGERACPPEDIGGIYSFNEVARARRGGPHELEDLEEIRTWLPEGWDPDAFDVQGTDQQLTALEAAEADLAALGAARERLAPGLVSVADRMPPWPARGLASLARMGGVLDPAAEEPGEEEVRAALVRPWLLLLEVARGDGIPLTAAGYLKPVVVERLYTELGMQEDWIGKGNREDLTPPVANLRASAQQLGLVRKHKGRLLQTKRGQALDGRPAALWDHLAGALPVGKGPAQQDAGTLALLHLAAGFPAGAATFDDIAASLRLVGWRTDSGHLERRVAWHAAEPTWTILTVCGGVTAHWSRGPSATAGGRLLARSALRR